MGSEHHAAVLVVEDDRATRISIRETLADEGYTIYEAPDGLSALARLRGNPDPLIVLLDWMMPGMDGLEVLHALAADDPTARRHRYILMSAALDAPRFAGQTFPPDLEVAMIGKPFDLDRLLDLVARAAATLAPPV